MTDRIAVRTLSSSFISASSAGVQGGIYQPEGSPPALSRAGERVNGLIGKVKILAGMRGWHFSKRTFKHLRRIAMMMYVNLRHGGLLVQ